MSVAATKKSKSIANYSWIVNQVWPDVTARTSRYITERHQEPWKGDSGYFYWVTADNDNREMSCVMAETT